MLCRSTYTERGIPYRSIHRRKTSNAARSSPLHKTTRTSGPSHRRSAPSTRTWRHVPKPVVVAPIHLHHRSQAQATLPAFAVLAPATLPNPQSSPFSNATSVSGLTNNNASSAAFLARQRRTKIRVTLLVPLHDPLTQFPQYADCSTDPATGAPARIPQLLEPLPHPRRPCRRDSPPKAAADTTVSSARVSRPNSSRRFLSLTDILRSPINPALTRNDGDTSISA